MIIYRGLVVENTNPSPSVEEILELEKALGCSLPDDYKDFLKICNGGYMDYQISVPFPDGTSEYIGYCGMYSVMPGEWETNPYELQQARKLSGLPSTNVIPVGRDGGGSVLYLDLRTEYKVVAYVEGLPGWTNRRQEDSLVQIASSFNEYLSKLVICDEIAQDHIEHFEVTGESVEATVKWLDTGNQDWRVKFRDVWNKRVPDAKV